MKFMRLMKALLVYSSEILLSLVLVLVFFFAVLGILNWIFPSGAGLREMMAQERLYARTGPRDSGMGTEAIAASLKELSNAVKSKRADAVAWEKAIENMTLYDMDAVQTFEKSSAVIEFDSENYLRMGNNSLVILKRIERDSLLGQRRSFMVVVEGELTGRIAAAGMGNIVIEIETPGARMKIPSSDAEGKAAEFKVTVNPDKSSSITVYEGRVEVESEGEVLVVEKNETKIVSLEEKTAPAITPPTEEKPSVPQEPVAVKVRALLPDDGAKFHYRDLAPKVVFTWREVPGGEGYRFVLATDRALKKRVSDERLKITNFTHGNLKDGEYYWRVTCSVNGGIIESEIRSFTITKDLVPPHLDVEFPPKMVKQEYVTVKGRTESGARVFIMDRPIEVQVDGSFEHRIQLQQGMNVIVIEAVDMAGNVTYKSSLVNGKF